MVKKADEVMADLVANPTEQDAGDGKRTVLWRLGFVAGLLWRNELVAAAQAWARKKEEA